MVMPVVPASLVTGAGVTVTREHFHYPLGYYINQNLLVSQSQASDGAALPPVMNKLSSSSSLTKQKWLVGMGSEAKGRSSF